MPAVLNKMGSNLQAFELRNLHVILGLCCSCDPGRDDLHANPLC